MKAGRELDALIAEKVMGLPEPDLKGHTIVPLPDSVRSEAWSKIPEYSTNIADAWLVVEKLKDKDLHFVFGTVVFDNLGGNRLTKNYGAFFGALGERIEQIEAETAPLAICLASLKAIGVQV